MQCKGPKSPALKRMTRSTRCSPSTRSMGAIGANLCAIACMNNIVQMSLSPITPAKSCTTKSLTAERFKKRRRKRDVEQVWSTIGSEFGYKLSFNPWPPDHSR